MPRQYNNIRPKEPVYIPLSNIDFTWLEEDRNIVEHHYSRGKSVNQIAELLERKKEDVLVMVLDMMDRHELNMICDLI